MPVILDAKRGDIGSTAQHYAAEAFDRYGADAVTANPYLGRDSVQPFLAAPTRACVILCRTSNPGARDFQDLDRRAATQPLYQHVAATRRARLERATATARWWSARPGREQLREVRAIVGDMPLLVPGVGAQGGDVEAVVQNGATADGTGLIVSSSRAILYASNGDDYADAARRMRSTLRVEIMPRRKCQSMRCTDVGWPQAGQNFWSEPAMARPQLAQPPDSSVSWYAPSSSPRIRARRRTETAPRSPRTPRTRVNRPRRGASNLRK